MDETIPCPRCHATGRAKLPRLLAQTLVALRRFGDRGATAEELHAALVKKHGGSFGVTAVNGRLEDLRVAGINLVCRKPEGRGFRYFRVGQ